MRSAYALAETVDRLQKDVAAKGIMMFFTVDQAKLAADAGIKLRPSTLLVFGNPALGAQFITSNPQAGLDWPVRLLVQEDEQGPGVGNLYRFRLDRAAAPHHRSRRGLQDGFERDRLHHVECRGEMGSRKLPCVPAAPVRLVLAPPEAVSSFATATLAPCWSADARQDA